MGVAIGLPTTIGTSSCKINGTRFDETNWDELFKEVRELYNILIPWFQISRSSYFEDKKEDYDADYDSFYAQAEMLWVAVRCDRYFGHDMPHLYDLLRAHDNIFKDLFGISIHKFLKGIENIQFSLSQGLGVVVEEMYELKQKVMGAVENIKENISEDELQTLMRESVKEEGWEEKRNSIAGRFLGFDLFDIQKITDLPTSLLRELSWEPGEDKEFFKDGEYKGWPLRLIPVKVRPFLKVKDKFYCFDLANLMDNIYRMIQRLVNRLRPDYIETWNSLQKDISEDIPFKLFERLLPNARIYKNIFYLGVTGTSGHAEWCEADGLIIFDDHLIILEIKGGAFTYTPPTTDFDAYINSVKELIRKPALQAKRFIDYLHTGDVVPIHDEEHKIVANIRIDQFRNITPCCVTLDSFTELAARSDKLKPIGVEMPAPVWSISIDDLRVYTDILNRPIVFTHFLEQRIKAADEPSFEVDDELDHLGIYLRHNLYVSYAKDLVKSTKTKKLNWSGYRKEIDTYYHDLTVNSDNAKEPLKKEIDGYFKDIIEILCKKEKTGRCKAGSYLLDMSGDARRNFNKTIIEALQKQEQKKRILPLSFIGDVKLTIFCHSKDLTLPSWEWMRNYTFARMRIANDDIRMILQIYFNEENRPTDVDFAFLNINKIPSDQIGHIEQEVQKIRSKSVAKALTEKGRIGRNDMCPCGSGKKYKRCCIKRDKS